jgi:hypothetical protein
LETHTRAIVGTVRSIKWTGKKYWHTQCHPPPGQILDMTMKE